MINYYEVLNCRADSTLEELRKNYKQLALKFHPDKNKSNSEIFLQVQEAWNVLSDERKRQQFDLETELRSSQPLLYGSFKIAELDRDSDGNHCCPCRCGGTYILNEEDLKLMEDCGCQNKCLSRLPQTIRDHISKSYLKLTTCNEKYLYLSGLIYKEGQKEKNPARKKPLLFHVRVDGLHICVCQKAYEIVHDLSSKEVGKVVSKLKKNVICLNPEDELFVKRATFGNMGHPTSTSAKDKVIKHIESTLSKSEVKEYLLKGEKLNRLMLYADYKFTLEKEKRLAALKFESQSGSDGNDLGSPDYEPVSESTYRALLGKVYPGIVEKLKNEHKNIGQVPRTAHFSLPSKSRSVQKKPNAEKANKRPNSTVQPKWLSAKKMTSAANDLVSTQNRESQPGNLFAIADSTIESATYLLPTSTKIVNKQTNLPSDVVETVYYV